MRLAFIVCAFIAAFGASAQAQSLNEAAARSEYIAVYLKFLKRKNAVSVYAGTKPYCPALHWWSSTHASATEARRGFQNQIAREMGTAGFSKSAISHCVENSGFLLENGRLKDHPKNKSYKRYVQPGIMVHRNRATGATTTAPVMIETNTYSDRSWRIFDHRFKPVCTYTSNNGALNMNCRPFGKLTGRIVSDGDNRWTLPMRS